MSLREILLLVPAAVLLLVAIFITAPQAQQQQQNFSPSEIAIAISSNVNALASALENANRQIKTLTEKNAELQKQVDELKLPSKK